MVGRKSSTAEARERLSAYTRLARDEKLRRQLATALNVSLAARRRAKRQLGPIGLATRLGSDPVLRAQVAEAIVQIQKARARIEKSRSHTMRNALLFATGVGMVLAAVPDVRQALREMIGGSAHPTSAGPMNRSAIVEEEAPAKVR